MVFIAFFKIKRVWCIEGFNEAQGYYIARLLGGLYSYIALQ